MVPEHKLSALIDAANQSESVRPMLRGFDRVVRLSLDQEACDIVTSGGRATLRTSPDGAPDLSFTLSHDTLDALLAGRVTPLAAKMSGKIRSSGSIVDVLRFASILSAAVKAISRAP